MLEGNLFLPRSRRARAGHGGIRVNGETKAGSPCCVSRQRQRARTRPRPEVRRLLLSCFLSRSILLRQRLNDFRLRLRSFTAIGLGFLVADFFGWGGTKADKTSRRANPPASRRARVQGRTSSAVCRCFPCRRRVKSASDRIGSRLNRTERGRPARSPSVRTPIVTMH